MSQELNKAPPPNCRQQLAADGKPYPRSSCAVCGQFSPRWKECDALLAAGPLPPAGNDPELRKVVTEALVGMIAAVTCTTPPADGPLPGFIQAPVDRAVTRIGEHVTRLQAENAALQQRLNVADQRVDDLEGELTKARELLNTGRSVVGRSAYKVNGRIAWLCGVENFLAHQSAPAAKACPACGQIDNGQTGEYPCQVCALPTTHDAPAAKCDHARKHHEHGGTQLRCSDCGEACGPAAKGEGDE